MTFIQLFGYIFYVMECEPGRDTVLYEPPSDYPGLPKYFATMLMTFRNSIGDLAPPDYAFWILEEEEKVDGGVTTTKIGSLDRRFFIVFIWFVWII